MFLYLKTAYASSADRCDFITRKIASCACVIAQKSFKSCIHNDRDIHLCDIALKNLFHDRSFIIIAMFSSNIIALSVVTNELLSENADSEGTDDPMIMDVLCESFDKIGKRLLIADHYSSILSHQVSARFVNTEKSSNSSICLQSIVDPEWANLEATRSVNA